MLPILLSLRYREEEWLEENQTSGWSPLLHPSLTLASLGASFPTWALESLRDTRAKVCGIGKVWKTHRVQFDCFPTERFSSTQQTPRGWHAKSRVIHIHSVLHLLLRLVTLPGFQSSPPSSVQLNLAPIHDRCQVGHSSTYFKRNTVSCTDQCSEYWQMKMK